MMYELFGFDPADFKELFYVFCLAVLVYRYITVGRKHPLFRSTAKSEQSSENSVISSQAPLPDSFRIRHWDMSDPRSNEYNYNMKRNEEIFSPDDK